jgi:hypothetical protein
MLPLKVPTMPVWSPRLLEPADVVRAAERLAESPFVDEYGDAPWLAIHLPAGEEGMAAALLAAHEPDRGAPKALQPIEFHTQMATKATVKTPVTKKTPILGANSELQLSDIAKVLGERCYLSAIRRRGEGALGNRVSIGRAMNQDIILRHSSISKFHAYLQSTADDVWTVSDGGSKNGTSVNGARLGKDPRPLANGERLTFGSIEAVFIDARTVWRLLRAT